jgi:hypothetical protein
LQLALSTMLSLLIWASVSILFSRYSGILP